LSSGPNLTPKIPAKQNHSTDSWAERNDLAHLLEGLILKSTQTRFRLSESLSACLVFYASVLNLTLRIEMASSRFYGDIRLIGLDFWRGILTNKLKMAEKQRI
jgi:hypothetical protein